MPHVPRIAPISIIVESACLAMTRTAKRIDLRRVQLLRILDLRSSARCSVRLSWAVARLAVHSWLGWLYLKVAGELDRACRVTAEAEQCRGDRFERAINLVVGSLVAGCKGKRLGGRIERQPMLSDRLIAGLTDPGNRLRSSPESPIGFLSRPRICGLRSSQGFRVIGFRL